MNNFNFDETFYSRVDQVLSDYNHDNHDLVNILLDVQGLVPYHYIPMPLATHVSKALDVPLSKIYDVITFYSALSDKPQARHVIQICKSTTCRINEYQTLRQALEEELRIKVGEKTYDDHFGLEYSPCFGACDIAPAIKIGERVYGNLTSEKIKALIDEYRKKD